MKTIKIFCAFTLLMALTFNTYAQNEAYGLNDKAGHYLNVGDAKIYYEVYGEGQPIILLY